MAIYRLSATVISRSQGRSSVAAAAYRAGVDLKNERDGLEHKYSNRQGVVHSEIMLPDHAPDRFSDRSILWNEVEKSETRSNSQTAREIQLALPHELTEAERLDLVRDFVREQFVSRGMCADVAIHSPGGEGNERNHHAHILLTTREVDGEGFTVKNRDWNAKELLEHWRAEWAHIQNRYLERHELTVDHRSIHDQRQEQLEQSAQALERGELDEAATHTAKAQELDREPRVYLGREDFQTAMLDKESLQAQLLARSYAAINQAKELAQEFLTSIRESLSHGVEQVRSAWDDFWSADVSKVMDGYNQSKEADQKELEKTHERKHEKDWGWEL